MEIKGLRKWRCPQCGKLHLGFKQTVCRNENCSAYALSKPQTKRRRKQKLLAWE
ncbi:MAG: hypothetical protein ACYTFA_17285 [Planctomycetota bacterium]|jgi:hypothetical protein